MDHPNPAPDLSAVPRGRAFATVSLLSFVLFVGQLLLSPVLAGALVVLLALVLARSAVAGGRRIVSAVRSRRASAKVSRDAPEQAVDVTTAD